MKRISCSILGFFILFGYSGVTVGGSAEAQRVPAEGPKRVEETSPALPSANKAQRVPEGLKKVNRTHPVLPTSYVVSPASNAKWRLGTNQTIEWITDATPGEYEVLLMQNNQVAGIIDDGYSGYMSPTDGKTLRYVRPWTKAGLFLYGGMAEPGTNYKIRVKNKATNKYFHSPVLTLYKPTVQKVPAGMKKVSPTTPPIPFNISIDKLIVYGLTSKSDGTKIFHFHATVTSTKDLVHLYVKFTYGYPDLDQEVVGAIYKLEANIGREIQFDLELPGNAPFKGKMEVDCYDEWEDSYKDDNVSTLDVSSLL